MNKPPEDYKEKQRLISSIILKAHQMDSVQLRQFVFVANCLTEGIEVSELRLFNCQNECDRLRTQVQNLKNTFEKMTEVRIKNNA